MVGLLFYALKSKGASNGSLSDVVEEPLIKEQFINNCGCKRGVRCADPFKKVIQLLNTLSTHLIIPVIRAVR